MDLIDKLPIDKNVSATDEEKLILQKYFGLKDVQSSSSSSFSEFKFVLLATLLFLGLSTSLLDKVISFFPNTDSIFTRLAIKSFIYFSSLYVILILIN